MAAASEAVDWNGSVSSQWNTPENWNGGVVPGPGQDARIDLNGANFPVINADIVSIPTDIRVAQAVNGNARLDHTSGFASTGSGNWMTVGASAGAVGIYNLANTSAAGGTLTGYGIGSGSMRVDNSNLWVGGTGNEAGGTGTVNINTTGILNVGNELNVGANGGTGSLRIDAGTINGGGGTYIGRSTGTGILEMSGGTLTRNGEFFVGVDAGSTGALVVSGGAVTINNWLNVGRENGTGSVTMTGGKMTVEREVRIGWGGGGNGTLALSGGATLSGGVRPGENNNVSIGSNGGTGTATVTGVGTFLFATAELHVGNNENSTGNLTVSGGTVSSASWMAVGREGSNGTLTINGSGTVIQGSSDTNTDVAFELTNNNKPSSATVNLDGGTLLVNRVINNGGGNTNLNFNGGTLKARADRGDFLQGLTSVTIKAGGAIFDTNGRNITVGQALVTDVLSTGGGLTKNGAGNLALNAGSTHTGATIVNSGKLVLNPNATIANSSGIVVNGGRGVVVGPSAGGPASLAGAVLFVQNEGNASSNALGTVPVTLNGGTLEYHGGQGAGLSVNTLNLATGGAIAAQPQSGGGLISINNLQLNAGGTSTATFISTYGNIGSGDNTADVGHVNIATINGTAVAGVIAAQNGILGGWATTFSTNNNADSATHFATHGVNGVQAVVYDGGDITAAAATHNIRATDAQTVSVSKTINSLESFDNDIQINSGVTLTIETGGLIFGGASHWIKEGTGAGAITAGASSGNVLFATINDPATDYRIHDVSITNRGATAVGFAKAGSGLLSLDTTNTYTGATTINGGTLKFNRASALYNGTVASWTPANITVNSGGTVAFNVGGAGEFTNANVTTLLTTLTTVANNGLRADSSIGFDTGSAASGFTIADTIKDSTGVGGGAVGVTKMGGNTLVLSGANTYSGGTLVSGGTLQASGSGTFGKATNAMTVSGGATVDLNGTNQSVGGLNGSGTISNSVSGVRTLTINNELAGGAFGGVIGGGAGTLAVTKTGDALQVLSGASTYTGATTVNAGTLRAGVASIANTSGAFGINSAVVLGAIGASTLDLANFDTQIGSLSGGGSTASRVLLGTGTLTVGADNTSPAAFAGGISGAGGLIKIGTGTQVLSNVSNFGGGTTVNGGTLQLSVSSGSGALAGNGPIIVNSGATLASGAVDGLGFNNFDTNNGITINQGGTLLTLEGGRLSMDRPLNVIGGTIASIGTNFNEQASYAFRAQGEGTDPVNSYNFTSSPSGVASTISATNIGVNGAVFNVTKGGGAVDLNVTGAIVDKFGTGGLTKAGDGVMVIANAANPLLTGPTTISNGTLLVNGSISGSAVTVNGGTLGGDGGTLGSTLVALGGTLAPGSVIGTLNFANSLTLEGTALFQINKAGSLLTADLANVTSGLLTLGGNLTVTASGTVLTNGDTFDLFNSATSFAGNFASVNLPTLSQGLSWDTSDLATDGTIAVIPEPGAVVSLLGGIGLLLGMRRRRSVSV